MPMAGKLQESVAFTPTPPPLFRRRYPNNSAEHFGGLIFRQNSFPVAWILVPDLPFGCCVVRIMLNCKTSLNFRKKIFIPRPLHGP